jgi:hypothetical protein
VRPVTESSSALSQAIGLPDSQYYYYIGTLASGKELFEAEERTFCESFGVLLVGTRHIMPFDRLIRPAKTMSIVTYY